GRIPQPRAAFAGDDPFRDRARHVDGVEHGDLRSAPARARTPLPRRAGHHHHPADPARLPAASPVGVSSMINGQRVVVVMPAYHAEKTLERTYAAIPREVVDEVILADDASGDGTAALARSLGIRTLVHDTNQGYGANQKTCYREALERG